MDVVPQNVHWLIPEENCPCDIFLHFRGQFPKTVEAGQPFTIATLEKLARAKCYYIYIRKIDLPAWEAWAAKRHAVSATSLPAKESDESSDLYGNKRAELMSYLRKVVQKRDEADKNLDSALAAATALLQKVINTPMLDWYFQQFHEPPHSFQHNGRVALTTTTFALLYSLAKENELESLIYSTVIHELEGSPETSMKTVASQTTLAQLEKAKHPVPSEVIALIQVQDELCSGKGFPNNRKKNELPLQTRIFSLFNHFDHFRLKDGISRRARFQQAKKQMEARKGDYDQELWESFWDFWENRVEIMG